MAAEAVAAAAAATAVPAAAQAAIPDAAAEAEATVAVAAHMVMLCITSLFGREREESEKRGWGIERNRVSRKVHVVLVVTVVVVVVMSRVWRSMRVGHTHLGGSGRSGVSSLLLQQHFLRRLMSAYKPAKPALMPARII